MTTGITKRVTGFETGLPGLVWLAVFLVGGAVFFQPGMGALVEAWATPEYSHGPLIPLISAFLLLKHLQGLPPAPGVPGDTRPGLAILGLAIALGGAGHALQIPDFLAYGMIVAIAGLVVLAMGWARGRLLWPAVAHLVFMLPLPGVLYFGLSTYLQGVSSELGVHLLRLISVPVFLDGHIIDLGVYKLHVAEACSGLRYLFPILSFAYIFAVLYRGPAWHKAVLLVSAVPITVLMNSVRIAIAGVVVDRFGTAYVDGLTHFLEGWVIFVISVAILFLLARLLVALHPARPGLAGALDLDTRGLGVQAARVASLGGGPALATGALMLAAAAVASVSVPERPAAVIERAPFALFPADLQGGWQGGRAHRLDPEVERVLAADDYLSVAFSHAGGRGPAVDLFVAWYADQRRGGTHSPEVCLPAGGWEIAELARRELAAHESAFVVNRAIIQKGVDRMLVYYWFDQQGVRTASGFRAKLELTLAKLRSGRSDGALVRLVTPIDAEAGGVEAADARLGAFARGLLPVLPRFLPGG